MNMFSENVVVGTMGNAKAKEVLTQIANKASRDTIIANAQKIVPDNLTPKQINQQLRAAIRLPTKSAESMLMFNSTNLFLEDGEDLTFWNKTWQSITDAPKAIAGFFTNTIPEAFNNAWESFTGFFKAGDGTTSYTKVTGVVVLLALLSFSIYKLIKWFRSRKEETSVNMLNNYCGEYLNLLNENKQFHVSLSNKFLTEDIDQNTKINTTLKKAEALAPDLASYALEAEEEGSKTKSIFKKYGYKILGAIAGTVAIAFFAYLGYAKYFPKAS